MILRATVYSAVLDMEVPVCFASDDDFTCARPRSVAYLLHGLQGCAENFITYTRLADYCRGDHVLFVMPDAQRSFFADMVYGGRYFTYLCDELPRITADLFRVETDRENSVIMGGSMGGYGALKAAFTHPERYGACAAFSPACLDMERCLRPGWRTGEDADEFNRAFGIQLKTDFDNAFGPDCAYRPEADILALAKTAAKAPLRPDLYTCWGDQDIFLRQNRAFPAQMEALGWPIRAEEVPGHRHDWRFLDLATEKALAFFRQSKSCTFGKSSV